MSRVIAPEPVPLRETEGGALRIGNTRILMEVILRQFQGGASAEDLHDGYPSLDLADIYAVISYYLHHKAEVEEYMARVDEKAEAIRRKLWDPELQARVAQLAKNATEDDAQAAG